MSANLKIVFAGSMGAGKTTAIRAISEVEPIQTEVDNTDLAEFDKAETTVALDYGEVTLGAGQKLGLYGTPGQMRFDFMWQIVASGAIGVVVLIDNARPDPLADMERFAAAFSGLAQVGAVVVAVGRMETHPKPTLEDYSERLEALQLILPVMPADVRRRIDVLEVLSVLFQQLELTEDTNVSADDWLGLINSATGKPS